MLSTRTISVAVASLAGSMLIGCQSQAPSQSSKMILKSVGPDNIKAGVKFNVQPDGFSAAWLNTEGVPKTAFPVLAGVELHSVNVRDQGTLVTVLVPDKLTQAPGSYPIYLLDKATGKKSNEIRFVVK